VVEQDWRDHKPTRRYDAIISVGAFEHFVQKGLHPAKKLDAPVLTDAVASLDCRIAKMAEVGTHSVFFCEVEAIATALQPEGPIYFDRLYHRIGSPLKSADEAMYE
jgi:flavin reductase (DIM6/NTAB) family NADH-FMN oxidoreductase RutF